MVHRRAPVQIDRIGSAGRTAILILLREENLIPKILFGSLANFP
jgi:hypothetical protein